MDTRELEKAVRSAIRIAPREPVLATLAGNGQSGALLPAEFDSAVRTLVGRTKKRVSEGNKGDTETWPLPWF